MPRGYLEASGVLAGATGNHSGPMRESGIWKSRNFCLKPSTNSLRIHCPTKRGSHTVCPTSQSKKMASWWSHPATSGRSCKVGNSLTDDDVDGISIFTFREVLRPDSHTISYHRSTSGRSFVWIGRFSLIAPIINSTVFSGSVEPATPCRALSRLTVPSTLSDALHLLSRQFVPYR